MWVYLGNDVTKGRRLCLIRELCEISLTLVLSIHMKVTEKTVLENRHSCRDPNEPSHRAKETMGPTGRAAYLANLVCSQHDDISPFVKALGSSKVANALLNWTKEGIRGETRGPCSIPRGS